MLRFKPTFSLSSFTFIKRLYSSSGALSIRSLESVCHFHCTVIRNLKSWLKAQHSENKDHGIAWGTGSNTIPKKKKWKKNTKWLSEEALQIAEKRREAKSKGEKERYTHLNAEFQRKARRDKKAFLIDQCKEIEENNRMENTFFSSRKLEISREYSCKDGLDKGQKLYGPNKSRRY